VRVQCEYNGNFTASGEYFLVAPAPQALFLAVVVVVVIVVVVLTGNRYEPL
jgi:hypothetical protein